METYNRNKTEIHFKETTSYTTIQHLTPSSLRPLPFWGNPKTLERIRTEKQPNRTIRNKNHLNKKNDLKDRKERERMIMREAGDRKRNNGRH